MAMSSSVSTTTPPYREISFVDYGGIINQDNHDTRAWNTVCLSQLLQEQSYQTINIINHSEKTSDNGGEDSNHTTTAVFHFYNGIRAVERSHLIIRIGTTVKLQFHRPPNNHNNKHNNNNTIPQYNATTDQGDGHPPACWTFWGGTNITLTSYTTTTNHKSNHNANARALLHGGGPEWWGIPVLGYAQVLEHRPYLLLFNHTTQLHISDIMLQDAPFYHVQMTDVHQVHVHDVSIVSRRTKSALSHSLLDLSAFNTDGIDIAGHDMHVHDVDIWTQDDCIAVKDNLWETTGNDENDIDDVNPNQQQHHHRRRRVSSNMLFERIRASGLGFTIGSIHGTTVQNITFRDSILYRTYKGIYTKFRAAPSSSPTSNHNPSIIRNILYQNITMYQPLQYAIWMGPAQQNGGHTANPCHASPCSLCWPHFHVMDNGFAPCHTVPYSLYDNITLRNVTIINPRGSPGVLLGSSENPIRNLIMDNVQVVAHRQHGKGSAIPMATLYEWFPGLRLQVRDPLARWTQIGFWILVGTLLGVIVARQVYLQWWRRRRRRHYYDSTQTRGNGNHDDTTTTSRRMLLLVQDQPAGSRVAPQHYHYHHHHHHHDYDAEIWAPHCGTTQRLVIRLAMRGLVAVPILVLCVLEWSLTRRLHEVNEYFVCEGVENGTALGETFPVPKCLLDMTTSKTARQKRIRQGFLSGDWMTLTFWTVIFLYTTYWWLKFLLTSGKNHDIIAATTNVDDDAHEDVPYEIVEQEEADEVDGDRVRSILGDDSAVEVLDDEDLVGQEA